MRGGEGEGEGWEGRGVPYRVTCVVTKLVTEPTASNEQVMEQVMHYLLFGGKSK